MFDLILDSVDDFHTVEERRLHRIFCGLYKYKYIKEGLFGWAWDSWTNYNDSDEYYLHGFGVDLPSTKLTYSDTYVTTFHWCPKADGYFD